MKKFIIDNWSEILLILVGSFALITYILQERRKITEAASLIVQQIDEVQERIKEIQSYIVNGQLNETAFYESQIIYVEDYWNKYKHYFVRRIDSKSYRNLNAFYDCTAEIREQQQFMKTLQRNSFFVTQQVLANLESNYIISGLSNNTYSSPNMKQILIKLTQSLPADVNIEDRVNIDKLVNQIDVMYGNVIFSAFWKEYEKNKLNVRTVIDQKGLTPYIPIQIKLSLESAIKQYSLLEITGCMGYRKLEKFSKRKF